MELNGAPGKTNTPWPAGSLLPGSNGPPGMLAAPSAAPLGSKWSSSIPQTSGTSIPSSRKTLEEPKKLPRSCRAKGQGGFSKAGNSLGREGREGEWDLFGAAFKSQRCLNKEQPRAFPGLPGRHRRPSSNSRDCMEMPKGRGAGAGFRELEWGIIPREWQVGLRQPHLPHCPQHRVALPPGAMWEAWRGSSHQNWWMWPRSLQQELGSLSGTFHALGTLLVPKAAPP